MSKKTAEKEVNRGLLKNVPVPSTELLKKNKNPYQIGTKFNFKCDNFYLADSWDICNNCKSTDNNCHKEHAKYSMSMMICFIDYIKTNFNVGLTKEMIKKLDKLKEDLKTKKALI